MDNSFTISHEGKNYKVINGVRQAISRNVQEGTEQMENIKVHDENNNEITLPFTDEIMAQLRDINPEDFI